MTLSTGQNYGGADAGLAASPPPPPYGTVTGSVWTDLDSDGIQDADEPGIPGVAVVATDPDSGESVNGTTDADGRYSLTAAPVGLLETTYTVPPRAGYDPSVITTYVKVADGLVSQMDVPLPPPVSPPPAIAGRLWQDLNGDGVADADEPGLDGVALDLVDDSGIVASTTTDSEGNYSFDGSGLSSGEYVIQPSIPQGYSPSPSGTGNSLMAGGSTSPINFQAGGTNSGVETSWSGEGRRSRRETRRTPH